MREPKSSGPERGPAALVVVLAALAFALFAATDGFGLFEREPSLPKRGERPAAAMSSPPDMPEVREATGELRLGEAAPALRLHDLEGELRSLSEFRGRPLLVNMWASWCPPCVQEMPALERLHRQSGEDFAVLSLSVDEEIEAARSLVKRMGLSFPVLLDPEGEQAASWGTVKFPETWVLDAKGVVVARIIGAQAWDQPEISARLKGLAATGRW